MQEPVLVVRGPTLPEAPLVLDSPHSGTAMPADFASVRTVAELREGEDTLVDELFAPVCMRGVPLLAASFPRTYVDVNRHADDVDGELLDGHWPTAVVDSGKARIGKAVVWRTLDGGRPIYAGRLAVAAVRARIDRCHAPYHRRLAELLDAAHARFGYAIHLNCHSMASTSSDAIEGVAGRPRPDIVLGDREGTSCAPALTAFVRDTLAARGHDVRVNDPFKGVELVRVHGRPAENRHSLQLEVNKRLYLDAAMLAPGPGYAALQRDLLALVDAILDRFRDASSLR